MPGEEQPSFDYLLDKFAAADFQSDPFPHLFIDNFLNPADFEAVVGSVDVTIPACADVDELFTALALANYTPIEFPGCTKDRDEYVAALEPGATPNGLHEACESMGMVLRCTSPQSPTVKALDDFFRSEELSSALRTKFEISRPTALDGGLQKYLHGYEVSPHPDIRQKALTWMLNVNPGSHTEANNYHTHYMVFAEQWDFVRRFWRDHPEVDTCWVPWDWCVTTKQQTSNNSIVVFAPTPDTMHAVKASYDQLAGQRTQFYGNLWYEPPRLPYRPTFQDFADGTEPQLKRSVTATVRTMGARLVSRGRPWTPTR